MNCQHRRICQSQRTALCFIGDACPDSERSPISYAVFEKRTTKKPKHNHLELNSGKIVRYIMMIPNSAYYNLNDIANSNKSYVWFVYRRIYNHLY
ncbi:hypothetical protein QTP88_022566 [Uroleucon formosanum]